MSFPLSLDEYRHAADSSLTDVLLARIQQDPFNLAATLIFLGAIIHTFFTPKFLHLAHVVEERHARRLAEAEKARGVKDVRSGAAASREVSFWAQILHFFGEIEAVFGIWGLFLGIAMAATKGFGVAVNYLGHTVNYTEPLFVVVIMALASTRPILDFAERGLRAVASLGKRSVAAWWLTLLILAPLLGSFITEPAAMTIAALLLSRQFYEHKPSTRLAYATLGLLFVNISVGGTLTHFAAPPVLMVAGPWNWGIAHMFDNFGWRAAVGIAISTLLYYAVFRKEFSALQERAAKQEKAARPEHRRPIPAWITAVQIGFMAWTVAMAHYPALFIAGFLFFLAFSQATSQHQQRLDMRSPMLVGFFLAGLVVHGGLQGWWIEPILTRLTEWPLFFGAMGLTAFNDNAAITYLATLVRDFGDPLKHAVVAGAVAGGGLTVIANAPNPAGQSILQSHFKHGISPVGLLLGALVPTAIVGACLMLL